MPAQDVTLKTRNDKSKTHNLLKPFPFRHYGVKDETTQGIVQIPNQARKRKHLKEMQRKR
jgi:hypothetical protein